jgi:hypothetical protein
MAVTPLETALSTHYDTDAHFVTYVIDGGEEDLPRLNKPCLKELEEAGADVRCTMLVLDFDNPDHAQWTQETLGDFCEKIAHHENSIVREYTAFYTTKHGARFVYVLSEPVPVLEAELRLQSLVAKFHALGIAVDKATKDWTRLFRLPFVNRDEHGQTWDDPLAILDVQDGFRLPLDTVPALGQTQTTAYVQVDADQPTPEEAEALLMAVNESGRRHNTVWYKDAKKMLHGRDCYGCIFEDEPLADHGERNPTVFSYAGSVVAIMHGRPGTTIQKCYALLLPAIMQLEGMDGNRSWEEHLWHSLKHAWSREEGKAQEQAQEEEVKQEEILHGKAKLLAGVRKWAKECGYKGGMRNDEELWAWLRERMVVTCNGQYFVLRRDGYYARTPCRKDALPASIRREGIDEFMDFWDWKEDKNSGEMYRVERPIAKVLSEHLTTFDYICGRANLPGSTLALNETGQRVLTHGIYSLRKDIRAKYNKDVDEWLHMLARDVGYETLIKWIAHSLDFSRPICAMSMVGPPSCGKGMLVRALAECITTKTHAEGDEIVSEYQYEIQRTPFLNIDENFPNLKFGKSAADNFRRWVGGGSITVNAKFQIPLKIQSPLRVILTANNHNVVREITQGRTLSIEDRDAIATRIFHWEAPKTAGKWLLAKGGYEHTAGWIDGADGEPGNATVARHFLWLYENRTPAGKGRFLMEGACDADVVLDMALESGIMLDVIETIISMVVDQNRSNGRGLYVDERAGGIYVLSNAVVNYWNKVMRAKRAGRGQGLHHRSVAHALRTLKQPGWREGVHRINKQQGRWTLVNNQMLLRAALNNGFDTETLIAMIEAEKSYE